MGEGTPPTAFWRNWMPLVQRGVGGEHRAADHVGVAVQVLGGGVADQVDAQLERPLEEGGREGVVDHAASRRGPARWRRWPPGRRS